MNTDTGDVMLLKGTVEDLKSSKKVQRTLTTWSTDDPINDLDQAMIARSVLQRTKRLMKRCDDAHRAQYKTLVFDVTAKLQVYHANAATQRYVTALNAALAGEPVTEQEDDEREQVTAEVAADPELR